MRKIFLGAAAVLAVTVTSSQAASWNIQPFAEVPGAAFTLARGINDAGVIVGDTDTGTFVDDHGTRTTYTGVAGGFLTAISNNGVLVGDGPVDSFIDDHGSITAVSVPGAVQTEALGISPNGRYVAGTYLTDLDHGDSAAFILDRSTSTFTRVLDLSGGYVMLHGINDDGVAVGNGGSSNLGLVYDLATGTSTYYDSLDGITHLRLRAITDAGELGGWGRDSAGRVVGIIGTLTGGFSTLSFGEGASLIEGLNGAGVAVGSWADGAGNELPVVATPLSAVPEPASWGLLLAGALVLAARSPRVRRNPAS